MIEVYEDPEALSRAAADLFAREALEAVRTRGRFSVALSGGTTPKRVYELLAAPPHASGVLWSSTHVFWGDERCVPEDDPRSNARMARTALLDRVPIPPGNIHPIACGGAPADAALGYEEELRGFFGTPLPRFDLVLLGLGENGHTASLFPGTDVLAERERWAREVFVAEQGLFRVTLTVPVINNAATAAFVVSGEGKAQVLREVLEGTVYPFRLPARLIKPLQGRLVWMVDRAAAAGLERKVPGGTA